jgi:hypothetical protein
MCNSNGRLLEEKTRLGADVFECVLKCVAGNVMTHIFGALMQIIILYFLVGILWDKKELDNS